VDSISEKKVFLLTYHVASYTTEKTYFFTTPSHEVTHIFQSLLSNEVGYGKGMPISLWEGSAVLFGAGISMPNLGWYSDELDHVFMRFLSEHDRSVEMRNNADAVKLLKAIEDPRTAVGNSGGYNVGPLLFEWFVAQYGVAKYVSLVESTATANSFERGPQTDNWTFKRSGLRICSALCFKELPTPPKNLQRIGFKR